MQNKISIVNQYYFLVRSLGLIALPYSEQQETLPEHNDILDEVVSDFNDTFHFVPQLMEIHKLSYKAVTKILHCYTMMDMNLSIEERITDVAFEQDASWQHIRSLAIEALIEMGEFDWRIKAKSNVTRTEI